MQFWDREILDVRGTSFQRKRLTADLRTITSDRTVYTIIRRFLFAFEHVGTTSLDRNYREAVNFKIIWFAFICTIPLNILETWGNIAVLGEKVLDVCKGLINFNYIYFEPLALATDCGP